MNPRIHQLHQPLPNPQAKAVPKKTDTSFKQVLQETQNLKISKHAEQRLKERNIDIGDERWKQISERMSEAKAKGVTDSLVITDEATLVVSTKNNTVVTALGRQEAASKIFTNINGTILMDD